MTLYVITGMDRRGTAQLRLATREAHLAFMRAQRFVRCQVGGPLLSADGTMIGSMLIVESDDPAQVATFVAEDPYGKAGLFEHVEVRPWRATVGTLG